MIEVDLVTVVFLAFIGLGGGIVLGSYLESRFLYKQAKRTCEALGYDWKKFRDMMRELMRG